LSNGYPIMLQLEGRTCVIVGGGTVAARKVDALLAAGAQVTVISPVLHPTLVDLAQTGKISVQQVIYSSGMVASQRPLLVFAATDDPVINQQIAEEARSVGALVDVVDEQGDRDFTNMATVQRGLITLAISTGGSSPALAAHIKQKIEQVIGDEYAALAAWMSEARSLVQTRIHSQAERAALWHQVLESSILDRLRQGDSAAAHQLFNQIIQQATEQQL